VVERRHSPSWGRQCSSTTTSSGAAGSSFTGPVYQDPRGSGPLGQTPQATTRKGLVPQTLVTMAPHPSIGPEVVRSVSSAKQEIQQAGASRRAGGRTNIASCLFANGRGHQKRRRRLRSLKGRTSRCQKFEIIWENGSSIGLTFSAPTRPPLPKVVEIGYTGQPVPGPVTVGLLQVGAVLVQEMGSISIPSLTHRIQPGYTG
jgi:hypothetical protein